MRQKLPPKCSSFRPKFWRKKQEYLFLSHEATEVLSISQSMSVALGVSLCYLVSFFCMLLLVPQEAIENKSGGLTQVKSAVRRSFCLSSCPAGMRFGSRRQQGMPKGDESSPSSCLSYLCYLLRYCMLDIDLQYVVPYANSSTRRQYL